MPPLNPVGQALKVRLVGTFYTRPWNNILHVQYSGSAPTSGQLITYCNSVSNAWSTNIAPICPTVVTLTLVQATDLTNAASASGESVVTVPGTLAGQPLSIQVALVISWSINLRYRGGHPRSYIPAGVVAETQSGNLWSDTFRATAAASGQSFLTAMNAISVAGSPSFMISVSYKTGNAIRPIPTKNPIVAALVHPRIDTQRRRLGKEIVT